MRLFNQVFRSYLILIITTGWMVLSVQMTGQIGLNVDGFISSSTLSSNEGRPIIADSTGKLLALPNGQDYEFFHSNGHRVLRIKPDSSAIQFFDTLDDVGASILYAMTLSNDFPFDKTGLVRRVNNADSFWYIGQESGDCFRTALLDPSGNQLLTINGSSGNTGLNIPPNLDISFQATGFPNGRRGTVIQGLGNSIYSPTGETFSQSTSETSAFVEFSNSNNFAVTTSSILGKEFIEVVNGILSRLAIERGDTFAIDVVANAANFTGGINVQGPKNFRINHPLDPQNKFLFHAAIESPLPYNLYRGKCITNEEGLAVVELPEYFSEINTDVTYHLTAIKSFSRVMISEELKNNAFVIMSEDPGVEVHWTVMAQRHDEYMRMHPYQTEADKSPYELNKQLKKKRSLDELVEDVKRRMRIADPGEIRD